MPVQQHQDSGPRKKPNRWAKPKSRWARWSKLLTPRAVAVMLMVLVAGSFVIRDSSGLTIYQKLSYGSSNKRYVSVNKEDNANRKILIDAGHGGFDAGAEATVGKKNEAELNLAVAKHLKSELQDAGFQVEMTREKDEALGGNKDADMQARRKMIEESNADLVVSVHMNTVDDASVNGPICFFMPGSTQGERLAQLIQKNLNDELDPKNPKKSRSENFFVLRSGKMPCILVECGFITNKDEAKKLENSKYQKRVAQSIAWGILDYYGGNGAA